MLLQLQRARGFGVMIAVLAGLAGPLAAESKSDAPTAPKGLRIYTAAHSLHGFVPDILKNLAQSAGIKDHVQVGLSPISASRVIDHWNVADDKYKSREVLRGGLVDVLTLSPIHLPDEGIENFTKLALDNNPSIRITVQEFWLPFDLYDPKAPLHHDPSKVDHNAPTAEKLQEIHAPYFKSMDEHVQALNKKYGKQVLLVVPAGQAVIALRERIIAGTAPGLKKQSDLFTDGLGHAQPPLQALVAYCHFAVIYQRSPVGLPAPAVLAQAKKPEWDEKLNRLLQELAWDAVTQHPLSGVKAAAQR